jgi:ParB family chromosome partitioning protein
LIHRGSSGVQEIEIDRIAPNPQQPRQQFDPEALEELAASIRQHGILQPVVVMRDGAGYVLIAGERRWRAAKIAGLTSLPALVKDASPAASLELALVENVQRADLTPLEEASAYRTLLDEHGLTQEQVAARVGRSRVAVTNRLRLLALPAATKARLADGSLTEGHARALLGLPDPPAIDAMAEEVVRRKLSVRETEELVRRGAGIGDPSGGQGPGFGGQEPPAPTPDTRSLAPLEEDLQRALGTRVQLVRSRRGGKLVIHYYDADQLDGLIELLLGRESA